MLLNAWNGQSFKSLQQTRLFVNRAYANHQPTDVMLLRFLQPSQRLYESCEQQQQVPWDGYDPTTDDDWMFHWIDPNNTPAEYIIVPHYLQDLVNIHFDIFDGTNNNNNKRLKQTFCHTFFVADSNVTNRVLTSTWILSPAFGALLDQRLDLEFSVDKFTESASSYLVDIVDIKQFHVESLTRTLYAGDLEPASWFIDITPVFTTFSGVKKVGVTTSMYVEIIMSRERIAAERLFDDTWKQGFLPQPTTTTAATRTIASQQEQQKSPITVCVWGSNELDGQKSIWFNQMKHLDPLLFRFVWILTSDANNDSPNTMLHKLKQLNITSVPSPFLSFTIEPSRFQEQPADGSPPFYDIWLQMNNNNDNADVDGLNDSNSNKSSKSSGGSGNGEVVRYISSRLQAANNSIEKMTPPWTKEVLQHVAAVTNNNQCQILVYGNLRGASNDGLLRDTARALKIPSVVELLNLFPDATTLPSAFVAPSHYAANHASVQTAINNNNNNNNNSEEKTKVFVIPPAVDLLKFNLTAARQRPIYFHPDHALWKQQQQQHGGNVNKSSNNGGCNFVNIGFMARLAPEKNVGLFLQFASHLLNYHNNNNNTSNACIRFTVIGDGVLMPRLLLLARRVNVHWATRFVGWRDKQLPRILAAVDILVNPSLRGWSETFCIANIEAMAVGVPVVTFAVGGIGEYVDSQPYNNNNNNKSCSNNSTSCNNNNNNNVEMENRYFSVMANAVVVHEATTTALTAAVSFLINNNDIREGIAEAATTTVVSYFTMQRQMQQYRDMYLQLAHEAATTS